MNEEDKELSLNRAKIVKTMVKNGINKYELADKMGVAPSTVYRVLNGERTPSITTAGKFIKSLDLEKCSFNELFIFDKLLPKGNRKGMV